MTNKKHNDKDSEMIFKIMTDNMNNKNHNDKNNEMIKT